MSVTYDSSTQDMGRLCNYPVSGAGINKIWFKDHLLSLKYDF